MIIPIKNEKELMEYVGIMYEFLEKNNLTFAPPEMIPLEYKTMDEIIKSAPDKERKDMIEYCLLKIKEHNEAS